VPVLDSSQFIRSSSSLIDPPPSFRSLIEITLPDIEYLKSVALVESDKPKLISLPFFMRESEINWLMHTLSSKECVHLSTVIAY
jgi:hypothetical protein